MSILPPNLKHCNVKWVPSVSADSLTVAYLSLSPSLSLSLSLSLALALSISRYTDSRLYCATFHGNKTRT